MSVYELDEIKVRWRLFKKGCDWLLPTGWLAAEALVDGFEEFFDLEGFGEVEVEAGFFAFLHFVDHAVAREGDGGNGGRLPNGSDQIPPALSWQANVTDDDVETLGAEGCERFLISACSDYLYSPFGEEIREDIEGIQVIFNEEQANGGG